MTQKVPKFFTKKKYAVNLKLFFWDLKHYAAKLIFHIFGKRNGLTFQKWTFLKCPISENCNTNLFHVFLWAGILWELILWEYSIWEPCCGNIVFNNPRPLSTKFLCIL